MTDYFNQLKPALIYGGLILGLSLLNGLKIDFYGWFAAFLSFLILAIHDVGKKYMELTNQSETFRHGFGMIVNPLLSIIILSSFFYVVAGEMHWIFWLGASFIGFILFVTDAVPWLERVKKP